MSMLVRPVNIMETTFCVGEDLHLLKKIVSDKGTPLINMKNIFVFLWVSPFTEMHFIWMPYPEINAFCLHDGP